MNSICTFPCTSLKFTVLILLCMLSGAEARLNAQEASPQASINGDLAFLPDAPSFAISFRTNRSQSSSEAQATPRASQIATTGKQIPKYRPLKVREKLYLYDLIGPGAFLVTSVQAGVDQSRTLKVPYPSDGFVGPGDHPAHGAIPEWGEGADGYAKRYASRFGQHLAGTTIRYGLGELLQEDVTYHRCTCTGVLPRVSHALVYSFVAYTKSGRAVPSLPAIVSPLLASEIAVEAWYPDRYNTSDALRTSANVYYTFPIKNIFFEFRKR